MADVPLLTTTRSASIAALSIASASPSTAVRGVDGRDGHDDGDGAGATAVTPGGSRAGVEMADVPAVDVARRVRMSRSEEARYRPWSTLHKALLRREFAAQVRAAQRLRAMGGARGGSSSSRPAHEDDGGSSVITSTRRRGVVGFIIDNLRDISMDWVLWANLWFLVPSIGYVIIDFARGYFQVHYTLLSALYILLAASFVADAVMYMAAWQGSEDPPNTSSRVGDAANIIASIGYVVTSVLYLYEGTIKMLSTVMFVEFMMAATFVVSAAGYLIGWWRYVDPADRRRGCKLSDGDMWGNMLNLAAALIYLVANAAGLWYHAMDPRSNIAALPPGGAANNGTIIPSFGGGDDEWVVGAPRPTPTESHLAMVSKWAVWGDVVYLVDAVVYCYVWYRDVVAASRASEEAVEVAGGSDTVALAAAGDRAAAVIEAAAAEAAAEASGSPVAARAALLDAPASPTVVEAGAALAAATAAGGSDEGGGADQPVFAEDALGVDDLQTGYQAFGRLGPACAALWNPRSACCRCFYARRPPPSLAAEAQRLAPLWRAAAAATIKYTAPELPADGYDDLLPDVTAGTGAVPVAPVLRVATAGAPSRRAVDSDGVAAVVAGLPLRTALSDAGLVLRDAALVAPPPLAHVRAPRGGVAGSIN